MFDEVGCNNSQKGDKKAGNEKVVGRRNKRKKKVLCTLNFRFTLLAITDFDGETLMCVIIFEGSERFDIAGGIDYRQEINGEMGDEDFFE